ncbi:CDP-alcohol phosphatidyltransferase family protein [Fimbriiglobus ruber]|uniref:CDP-diacylglycerol--glycerol-3-phosphate 3-phosphatidyltransferase n=1 Tax=Fimbriiglobus ruber TaxID=1908690 RepID=A0A225DSI4_9BACT|nr:CDP-alcohol phosphatidyltransferase family protein [Fimbriiglobus ruber]OWK44382.1 CDP-diacylglycerol--glycerol-3-phosphate 3-phosphatidyltransferase [Fimbriiglobus ruber]
MAESAYQPTDRRPIAARRWPIWQHAAKWLAHRGVSPNAISLAGMGCGTAAGVALAGTTYTADWEPFAWLGGAALIQLRLLANLLDGMVAIESGRASPVGELYNDVPDRVSDTATLVGAGCAVGGDVVLGCLAACAALFTAYVRAIGKAAGAPQEYCGPMAKQQRMALLTLIALYCGLAPTSWRPLWGDPAGRSLVAAGLLIITLGSLLTAARRLVRIAANLRGIRS